jgi:hypothetical protein
VKHLPLLGFWIIKAFSELQQMVDCAQKQVAQSLLGLIKEGFRQYLG